MGNHEMTDEKLRDILRGFYDERSRKYAESAPSFHEMWGRARDEHAGAPRRDPSMVLSRWFVVPALTMAADALFVRFSMHDSARLPREPFPVVAVQLQLPTDRLLVAAQHSYVMAKVEFYSPSLTQPQFPTDSLKWRVQ